MNLLGNTTETHPVLLLSKSWIKALSANVPGMLLGHKDPTRPTPIHDPSPRYVFPSQQRAGRFQFVFQQSGFCFTGDEAARRICNRKRGICWVNVAWGWWDFWLSKVFLRLVVKCSSPWGFNLSPCCLSAESVKPNRCCWKGGLCGAESTERGRERQRQAFSSSCSPGFSFLALVRLYSGM